MYKLKTSIQQLIYGLVVGASFTATALADELFNLVWTSDQSPVVLHGTVTFNSLEHVDTFNTSNISTVAHISGFTLNDGIASYNFQSLSQVSRTNDPISGLSGNVISKFTDLNFLTSDNKISAFLPFSFIDDNLNSDTFVLQSIVHFSGFVPNANARSNGVAATLDSLIGNTGTIADSISALAILSPTQQAAALERLVPLTNRAQQLSVRNNMLFALDRLSLRLDAMRQNPGGASGDGTTADGFWFKPFGGGLNQSMKSGFAGYNGSDWGLSGGFDHQYEGGGMAGLAFTYTKTNINYNNQQSGDTNTINSYQFSVYGTKPVDDFYLEGMVAYARQGYNSIRNTGISGSAYGNYDGDTWGVRLGAGMPLAVNESLTVTPIVRLDWNHIAQYGYGETGAGALNLNVSQLNADRLRSSLGLQINDNVDLLGYKTQPYLRTFWHYDFLNSGVSTISSFAGGGSGFITPGQSLDHHTGTVGAGLNVFATDALTASLGYDVNLGSGYQSHIAQANIKWAF